MKKRIENYIGRLFTSSKVSAEPPRAIRGSLSFSLALLIASSTAALWSREWLRQQDSLNREPDRPPLYLPDAEHVKLLTLGFNNFFSDILWFNTINYFGKQFEGTKDYRWLGHMCDLVTQLDGNATHAFEFCGTLVSWEAKRFDDTERLLTRAVELHPDTWRFFYLRGFNRWYFLNRQDLASEDFVHASKLPEAPAFLGSLASRLLAGQNNINMAIQLLQDLVKNSTDKKAKAALEEKLQRAVLRRDLDNLNKAVSLYKERLGTPPQSLDDIVREKFLRYIPREPFGGTYTLDTTSGEVKSSSGKKPLDFAGKNKDNGFFAAENKPSNSVTPIDTGNNGNTNSTN